MRHALLAILTVFVLALGTPVKAQSLEDGFKAYIAGDYSTAFEIWLSLAERGDATAQMLIGDMYRKGKLAPQDYAEAARWYQMAAEQGNAEAQLNVGFMYQKGQGVSQDHAKAVHWYRMAADQGLGGAQHNLGIMYGVGKGVPQNFITAHMWVNIAKANGGSGSEEVLRMLDELLTPEQIVEAQARAEKCFNSNYQDCD